VKLLDSKCGSEARRPLAGVMIVDDELLGVKGLAETSNAALKRRRCSSPRSMGATGAILGTGGSILCPIWSSRSWALGRAMLSSRTSAVRPM
jgi:hypothetical protein